MEETPKKEQSNIMAILSYIGVLCLIPILMKKKDEFVSFHAKQGFILFVAEVATWMVFSIFPFLRFLGNIFGLVWLVLSIIGIVNVLNKKKKEIPLLGRFAEKIKF
jgi:fumarate reductase subunit D